MGFIWIFPFFVGFTCFFLFFMGLTCFFSVFHGVYMDLKGIHRINDRAGMPLVMGFTRSFHIVMGNHILVPGVSMEVWDY